MTFSKSRDVVTFFIGLRLRETTGDMNYIQTDTSIML